MSSFTPAGSGGVPLAITTEGVSSPLVITLLSSGMEDSYTFPTGTQKWLLRARDPRVTFLIAFISGDIASDNYLTVGRGCFLAEEGLSSTSSLTIYLQTDLPGQIVEILSWS